MQLWSPVIDPEAPTAVVQLNFATKMSISMIAQVLLHKIFGIFSFAGNFLPAPRLVSICGRYIHCYSVTRAPESRRGLDFKRIAFGCSAVNARCTRTLILVVCLSKSTCSLDLSYVWFRRCKCTEGEIEPLFMHAEGDTRKRRVDLARINIAQDSRRPTFSQSRC